MPGSEIHAQLLENLYDETLAAPAAVGAARSRRSPCSCCWARCSIWATPRWKPRNAALLASAASRRCSSPSYALFRSQRLLFDAATPALGLLLLFGMLLVLTLAEATRQPQGARARRAAQREQSARIAGELAGRAAHPDRHTLPRAESLRDDARIDLAATMVPAREVGGDLYDFFRLDERPPVLPGRRRRRQGPVGEHVHGGQQGAVQERDAARPRRGHRRADARSERGSLARQPGDAVRHRVRRNPRSRIRRARTTATPATRIRTCSSRRCCRHRAAGRRRRAAAVRGRRLRLCGRGHLRMATGEMLCIVTDGVTEAQNAARRALRQRARAASCCARVRATARRARVVDALRTDVAAFVGTRRARGRHHRARAALARRDRMTRRRRRRQRTTISTRRLRGSATPSGVGTSSSRLPRPIATNVGRRDARPISARANDVGALAGERVVEGIGADRIGVPDDQDVRHRALAILGKHAFEAAFDSSVNSSEPSTKYSVNVRGAGRLRAEPRRTSPAPPASLARYARGSAS